MNFPYFEMTKIISFVAFVCFYITMVIILGIDKENRQIDKRVLLFGVITQTIYMLYLYISNVYGKTDMYRYGIYLAVMLILFILDTLLLKRKTNSYYLLQILMLINYILMFVDSFIVVYIALGAILLMIFYKIYKLIKKNVNDNSNILKEAVSLKIPIGFCFGISSIVLIIVNNFIQLPIPK